MVEWRRADRQPEIEVIVILFWIDSLTILIPGILLTLWARSQIARVDASASRHTSALALTGAETAEAVLRAGGASDVEIEPASGELGTYYDAGRKLLRLSRGIHGGRSLAAVGVAAHEAGHALQHDSGHPGLVLRNAIVPWTGLAAQVIAIVFVAGVLLGMVRLVVLAIGLFWLFLIVHLLNVPVELDASRRGREVLRAEGLVTAEEDRVVARVANVAAWSHVASALWGMRVF